VKAFFNILGGLFIVFGIIWIISVVVAVANHTDYPTLVSMIPALAIHAGCNLLGVIFIGLGRRYDKKAAAGAWKWIYRGSITPLTSFFYYRHCISYLVDYLTWKRLLVPFLKPLMVKTPLGAFFVGNCSGLNKQQKSSPIQTSGFNKTKEVAIPGQKRG